MKKRIKMGILGLTRGRYILDAQRILCDEMEVIAVCEENPDIIKELKGKLEGYSEPLLKEDVKICNTYQELLSSGIDAVVLCNYFPDHAKCAIEAMEKGVAVFSETTAAPSLGECVELVEAYERTGTKYMLAANCIFFQVIQEMKKNMEAGKYGKVVYADAEYVHPLRNKMYTDKKDLSNLHWRDTLPHCYYNMHDLGPLMYATNSMPKRVTGKAVISPEADKLIKDSEKNFMLYEMDNGAVFNTAGWVNVGSMSKWYRLACENGTMESVRYDEPEETIIEAGKEGANKPEEFHKRLLTWSSCGALTEEEEAKYTERGLRSPNFHGGVDVVLVLNFLRYLRGETEPFYNVYRAVALSAAGIMGWYSALSDSKPFDIPDFTKKEDRDKVRNDYRMPFASKYSDLTLPCRAKNEYKLEL